MVIYWPGNYCSALFYLNRRLPLLFFIPLHRKNIFYNMEGTQRKNIEPGMEVQIIQKNDQRSGKLTEGIVKEILTNSAFHPHGIKVRLTSGQVGRVKEIIVE
jgi:uncharacterized repeat protein (TIGR03833 family)